MKERICLRGVSQEVDGMAWDGFDLVRIGRQAQSELQLNDSSISRCHAELAFVDSQGWFVRDLGSTNGTFLNGVRVGPRGMQGSRARPAAGGQRGHCAVAGMDQAGGSQHGREFLWDHARGSHGAAQLGTSLCRRGPPRGAASRIRIAASGTVCVPGTICSTIIRLMNYCKAASKMPWRGRSAHAAAPYCSRMRRPDSSPLHASTGEPGERPAAAHYSSRTLVQRCLARGESLLSSDLGTEGYWRSDSINNANASSILCALLRSPQRAPGSAVHGSRRAADAVQRCGSCTWFDAVAASIAGSIESGQFLLAKQRSWFIQTVITLAQTIELRDPYTAGHAERVTEYALLLADELKLPAQARQQIEIGGPLHDIGKIGVRDKRASANKAGCRTTNTST